MKHHSSSSPRLNSAAQSGAAVPVKDHRPLLTTPHFLKQIRQHCRNEAGHCSNELGLGRTVDSGGKFDQLVEAHVSDPGGLKSEATVPM